VRQGPQGPPPLWLIILVVGGWCYWRAISPSRSLWGLKACRLPDTRRRAHSAPGGDAGSALSRGPLGVDPGPEK
jgi:hypothetical protein